MYNVKLNEEVDRWRDDLMEEICVFYPSYGPITRIIMVKLHSGDIISPAKAVTQMFL